MEKFKSGKADYNLWLSDFITIVGSLDPQMGITISTIVELDNETKRGRSKVIMNVKTEENGKVIQGSLFVNAKEGVQKTVAESRGA